MNPMQWMFLAFGILVTALALYLWLIAPADRPHPKDPRMGTLFAHRGLHDNNQSVIENSMKAFSLAVAAGYGMEMDLQTTRDGKVVVFHDTDTQRICGSASIIDQTDYADLPLLPDGTPIPLFEDLLKLVDGSVGLIIEFKYHTQYKATIQNALELLQDYSGPYCVESFHPGIVRYFKKHNPQLLRGQLTSGNLESLSPVTRFIMRHLLINFLSRPHFIAYDFNHKKSLSLWIDRVYFKALTVAWTIRSQADLDAAGMKYDMIIFEGFTPAP